MKKVLEKIFSRMVITILLIGLQVGFFVFELIKLSRYYVYISAGLAVLSLLVVFYLICQPMNPNVKIAWIVPILLFPLLGGLLYIMYGQPRIPKKIRNNMKRIEAACNKTLVQEDEIMRELMEKDRAAANTCSYLNKFAMAPVWKNTRTKYYKIGEEYWEALTEALEGAERFIFMEYFIVEEGVMWDSIHEILKRKASRGVEVRFMYDDMGCMMLLPYKYNERLEKEGIKSMAFNEVVPFMEILLNNRDHRKITVIDGKTAFTGGINLADEYVNHVEKYGHWKDTGLKIEGDAVWNFTAMFLEMWNTMYTHAIDTDILKYRCEFPKNTFADGYVQPYGDTPLDREVVGENVYMNIISMSRRYVFIYTPYLIVDNEMITTLSLAAKRGVDVRIVTPGVPDKKMVYWLTQSYYPVLLGAGVKIYQYSPGFIHAKCFLCDDDIAVVGTINMDYRSLYHHFECGVFLYQTSAGADLKADMEQVFAKSEEITLEWCKNKKVHMSVLGPVLKLFAPLM